MCMDGWKTPVHLPQAYSHSSPKIATLSVGAGIIHACPWSSYLFHCHPTGTGWQFFGNMFLTPRCARDTVTFWSHVAVATRSFQLRTVSATSVPALFGDAFIASFQLSLIPPPWVQHTAKNCSAQASKLQSHPIFFYIWPMLCKQTIRGGLAGGIPSVFRWQKTSPFDFEVAGKYTRKYMKRRRYSVFQTFLGITLVWSVYSNTNMKLC